jgi:hypothetical protein
MHRASVEGLGRKRGHDPRFAARTRSSTRVSFQPRDGRGFKPRGFNLERASRRFVARGRLNAFFRTGAFVRVRDRGRDDNHHNHHARAFPAAFL